MLNRRRFLSVTTATAIAGPARAQDMSQLYAGPEVTHVEVRKSKRALWLWSNGTVIHGFPVELGFAPEGPKRIEGDGKTPEGTYRISVHNPASKFYLSLGISYPNASDVARANALGKAAGGDIFIHGQSAARTRRRIAPDWTAGCIALKNQDMRAVYWMVRDGTLVTIRA